MTTRTGFLGSWFARFWALFFALLVPACGAAGLESAKSASGRPGENYDAAEAAAEAPTEEVAIKPSPAAPPPSSLSAGAVAQAAPARSPTPEAADAPAPTPGVTTVAQAEPRDRAPLLIYTATMTLAVFETRNAIGAVEELARGAGGYLVSRGDDTVTVRVPAKAFQGALSGVSKLGDELHRDVNVRDVTEQFADLEVRLKNAEAVRLRLEGLLQKAAKVEDALAVERELERVTQTIEQIKGRMRLLGELIAFSTITVNFRARPRDQVGSEVRLPFGWLRKLGLPPLMNLEAP